MNPAVNRARQHHGSLDEDPGGFGVPAKTQSEGHSTEELARTLQQVKVMKDEESPRGCPGLKLRSET